MRRHAMEKLEKKKCDLIVVNGPSAIDAHTSRVEVLDANQNLLLTVDGSKEHVARSIMHLVSRQLL